MNHRTFKKWLILLVLVLFLPLAAVAKEEKFDPKKLEGELKALETLARFFPVENKTPEDLRSGLIGFSEYDPGFLDRDLGFGWERRLFRASSDYGMILVSAFFFENTLAHLEISRKNDGSDWPIVGQTFLQKWREVGLPEYTVGKNDIHLTRTSPEQVGKFRSAVSGQLGDMAQQFQFSEFQAEVDLLTSPFEVERVSLSGCGDSGVRPNQLKAIKTLLKAGRLDLLGEALKGYSPSGRFYALLALLQVQKKGAILSPETLSAMKKVEDLPVKLTPCFGCLGLAPTPAKLLKPLFLQGYKKEFSGNE